MPGVCDAEADRRRGYKGIIIPKDRFKEFVEFQRRWVKKMIETIEILMEMEYNSGYAARYYSSKPLRASHTRKTLAEILHATLVGIFKNMKEIILRR